MNIPGADNLIKVFGGWPSFHDAEVLHVRLERADADAAGACIHAEVYVFERTNQVAADGFYVLKNHTLVSFRFAGVDAVAIDGFNHQNVLSHLAIVDVRDRQMEHVKYQVEFSGAFGVSARFLCRAVTIERIQAWNPSRETPEAPHQSGPRSGGYQPRDEKG